uniref:Uncharacterized protein n=1 Tax=Arundo donax TaxID=35708 RepID=A0A0A9CV31_ARUDO
MSPNARRSQCLRSFAPCSTKLSCSRTCCPVLLRFFRSEKTAYSDRSERIIWTLSPSVKMGAFPRGISFQHLYRSSRSVKQHSNPRGLFLSPSIRDDTATSRLMLALLRAHGFSQKLRMPMMNSRIADSSSLLSLELGHDL